MKIETIQEGAVYTYKGKKYRVLKLRRDTMIQYEECWHPIVAYTNEPNVGLKFVRSQLEFKEKFEAIQ